VKSVCLGVCACAVLAVVLPLGVAGEEPAPEKPPAGQAGGGLEKAPELLLWQEIPTVISASRHEEPASRAPNAVSIITREQIHASGMMSLGDLLRLAVGVDVGQIDAWNYAIGVRGLHGRWSNNTLVLMDGRSIYDPMFGGVMWGTQPVLLEDIERIEVVRGPGGAAWGANAANGVINIITKKPGDTPGFFLSQTLTDRLDSVTHMRYGATAGPLDFRLSAGYDSMPEIGVREGPGNHDFLRLPRASLRSTYHFDAERSLDVDAGYMDGVMGGTPQMLLFAGAPFESARWFARGHFLRMRFTHQKAPDDLWSIQYYLNQQTVDESEGGPWVRYTQHDVEAQRVRPWGDRHVLTYGGNVRADYLTNGDPPGGAGAHGTRFDNERSHDHQAGLFVQDRFEASDQWTLLVGARTDRNSYTGWEWAGRGTALYHPVPEHTFRLSMARAFRTPTLMERTVQFQAAPTGLPFPFPPFAMLAFGNDDLNPSYVKAYEFGYTYEKKNIRAGAEFYWNNYRGIIVSSQRTAPGAIPLVQVYGNTIDGDLYGFELSGQWQATQRLRLDAAYVWEQWVQQGTRAFNDPPLWNSVQLVPPQQKVGLGARYEPVKGLALNGRMWWVDEVVGASDFHVPPWSRFDFNVTKSLGRNSEVAVGVQNAFDSRHMEAMHSTEQPLEVGERTWFVRFQANF